MVAARREDQEARWFLGMLGMRQGKVLGLTDDSLDGAKPKDRVGESSSSSSFSE